MTKLQKLLQNTNFGAEVQNGKIFNKAEELYSIKPYAVEHKSKYMVFNALSLILQAASALLAYGFFEYCFSNLNKIVNVCFSICCVVLIEIVKKVFITSFFVESRKGKKDLQMLFFACFLIGISAITSLQGAKFSTYKALDKSEIYAGELGNKLDSIKQIAEAEKLKLQQEIDLINGFRAKRWKGVLTNQEQKQIDLLNKRIFETSGDHKLQASELKEKYSKEIETNLKSTEDNSLITLAIALVFEVLNLFCIWWISGYLHLVYLEANTTASVTTASVQTDAVQTDAVLTDAVNGKAPTDAGGKIGFTVNFTGEKLCENCGKAYKYKIHNQKFCTPTCKMDFWEKKHNVKLKFSKKN